jgi:hypothetical protein
MLYVLTTCCQASAKGGEHGAVCRACHRQIPDVCGWADMSDTVTVGSLTTVITGLGAAPALAALAAAGLHAQRDTWKVAPPTRGRPAPGTPHGHERRDP